MKSEFGLIFSLLTIGFLAAYVLADPVQTGFPVTITIGNPTTTTTTTTAAINNPANISFQINAKDGSGQSQPVNVTLYDDANHHYLNNSQFVGFKSLYSPTSLSDFEIGFDNQNLDILVNGLNMNPLSGQISQITVETSHPTNITNFTYYRGYHVELPWDSTTYSSITLTISLAGVSGVNYNNIVVYRCGSYNLFTTVCSDSGGWQPQTISVNQAKQQVSLNINHFSYYAVGYSSSQVSPTTSTSSTSSTSSATTSSTSTSTSSYTAPVSNNNPSSSGGGGGGGAINLPATTTTSSATTTTTLLIVRSNSTSPTSSSTSATTETAPITGFLGITNIMNPYVIAAAVIVISAVAVAWLKGSSSFPSLPFGKMYGSHGTFKTYGKSKKRKTKNTELRLSF